MPETPGSLWERSGLTEVPRGARVKVSTEETSWPAVFIGAVEKTNGRVRFVVEDQYGRIFIQNPKQVTTVDELVRGPP